MKVTFKALILNVLLIWTGGMKILAQSDCDKVQLNLTRVNATCASNGSIKVKLTGTGVQYLEADSMQFKVDGTVNWSWAHYPNDSITGLPKGNYTISMRAFCNINNDWFVASSTATIEITSNYVNLDAYTGQPIKTLNCKATGRIPIIIRGATGPYSTTANPTTFTITMISHPASYTGPTTFTTTRGSNGVMTTYNVDSLTEGDYTFQVTDACSYTRVVSEHVGLMTNDFPTDMFFNYLYPGYNYFEPYGVQTATDCKTVSLFRYAYTRPTDEQFYWNSYPYDYYEMGYEIRKPGLGVLQPLQWFPSDTLFRTYINFQLPVTYKEFRADRDTILVYLRVKGSSCQQLVQKVHLYYPITPSISIRFEIKYIDIKCDRTGLIMNPPSDYRGILCFPYKYRVLTDTVTWTEVQGWSAPKYTRAKDTIYNVPYSSFIQFEDANGFVWYEKIRATPQITYWQPNTYCYSTYGLTADTLNTYFYVYLLDTDSMPAGTKIRFLDGPKTPVHTYVELPKTISTNFYPFAQDYSRNTSSDYQHIPAGIYRFSVTLPGSSCDSMIVSVSIYNNFIGVHPVYEHIETCQGHAVVPKAGQIYRKNANGTISYLNTQFTLYDVPTAASSVPRGPLLLGDTLYMPTTGRYIIGMQLNSASIDCPVKADTFNYVKQTFQLNPDSTSAYECTGGGGGFIRVKGMGGVEPYTYELYDGAAHVATNTSGVFHYGSAGNTYTIKMTDACGTSYSQDVLMISLGIRHVAYTNHPDNVFCSYDSIYLKCVTLGQTTYHWKGNGINSTNENLQNPVIYAGNLNIGADTIILRVLPEGCGEEINDTLFITVEDCSGAHDDYVTVFVNSISDSIDILANDKFSAACAPTATPYIIVNGTKGSAVIPPGTKKAIYTPTTLLPDYDSVAYRVTDCNGYMSYANIYIKIVEKPDNISEADCFTDPPGDEWAITMKTNNIGKIYSTTIPAIVADVDNDGLPEILVSRPNAGLNTDNGDSVHVVSSSGVVKYRFPVRRLYAQLGAVGRVKMNSAGTLQTLLFTSSDSRGTVVRTDLAADSLKLFAYNPLNGNLIWKSNNKYIANMGSQVPALQLIDIDHDGWTEIVCGNKIFAAESGVLLYSGGTNRQSFVYGWSTGALLMHSMASDVLPEYPGNELCYGNVILYNINITNRAGTAGNTASERLWTPYLSSEGNNGDGAVQIADIDMDGYLDIVHTHVVRNEATKTNSSLYISVYSPYRNMVIAGYKQARVYKHGVPFIGDIDGEVSVDGKRYPEIVLLHGGGIDGNNLDTGYDRIKAFKYVPSASFSTLLVDWNITHSDNSGATGITLFDFNQDGASELVYRDNKYLRIIKGADGSDLLNPPYVFESATCYEYAVVADVDNDGEAEIIAVGDTEQGAQGNPVLGYLRIFKSGIKNSEQTHWAPARPVWNQFVYNPLFVRNDLTTPQMPATQVIRFAGPDGVLGNSDDVYPFNNYLQQATLLNSNGTPLWITPDAEFQSFDAVRVTDSIRATYCIENTGDAAWGNPIYIAFYRDAISVASQIKVDSIVAYLEPGEDTCKTIMLPTLPAFTDLVVRLNDKGYINGVSYYPWQPECNYSDSVGSKINPALSAYMKKHAYMGGVQRDGTYPNPVAVLNSEEVEYRITAVNANTHAGGTMDVVDTLPAYMDTVASFTITPAPTSVLLVGSNPARRRLTWSLTGLPVSYTPYTFTYRARTTSGANASQPLYINKAWVTVSDTLRVRTDSLTYHQGAGVSVVLFAAAIGGVVFAEPQAVDYNTTPRASETLIVPDSGYVFVGWSHPSYVSHRGLTIPAASGVISLDTLLIYGNVELTAVFEHATTSNDSIAHGNVIANEEGFGDIVSDGVNATIISDSIVENNTIADVRARIWSSGSELSVQPAEVPAVLKLYNPDGVLVKQQTILTKGVTKHKLPRGVYFATLNNGVGVKVRIE